MSKNEATTTKVSRVKIKKKNWYSIVSPPQFGKREMGETYLASLESAYGRTVKINLRELTGNVRDQNIYLTFKMVAGSGHTLSTEVIGYSMTPTSVKRLVRSNTDRLDDYFTFTSKDGQKVVVKTLIITLHQVQRSVSASMRKYIQEFLKAEIEGTDFNTFMLNLVGNKVLGPMKKNLHKIYPVKEAAIRVLELREETAENAAGQKPAEEAARAENTTPSAPLSAEEEPDAELLPSEAA